LITCFKLLKSVALLISPPANAIAKNISCKSSVRLVFTSFKISLPFSILSKSLSITSNGHLYSISISDK
jgi:hypothetical protein